MSPVSPVFHTAVTVSIGLKNMLWVGTSILNFFSTIVMYSQPQYNNDPNPRNPGTKVEYINSEHTLCFSYYINLCLWWKLNPSNPNPVNLSKYPSFSLLLFQHQEHTLLVRKAPHSNPHPTFTCCLQNDITRVLVSWFSAAQNSLGDFHLKALIWS